MSKTLDGERPTAADAGWVVRTIPVGPFPFPGTQLHILERRPSWTRNPSSGRKPRTR